MAEIIPFRALHYDIQTVGELAKVVTQPYDKISAEMQARYYELSPYNLARIIRGQTRAADTPLQNVYTRAVRYLHDWIENQILISETEPALYPYYQEYAIPGQPEGKRQRRGFIALCRVEDYDARVIHRHEETLSGPKVDRLELLKATRAHFGQIFVLYSDPSGEIELALSREVRGKPWQSVVDEYSAAHSVWRVTNPLLIERIVEAMRPKKLAIADGHHRYETALAYRNLCRERGEEASPAEYVMMTFIRMETDGLTILPSHRVLHSLPNFDWRGFINDARELFNWKAIKPNRSREGAGRFQQALERAGLECPTVGVFAGPEAQGLLSLRRDVNLAHLLPGVASSLARLDVVILHRLLLEQVLGIDRQAVREEKNLHYVREFDSALRMVETGKAQLCFLMNPTPIQAVWENALAGQVLPQKSTDFYPKLLSGLTAYWLDTPDGI